MDRLRADPPTADIPVIVCASSLAVHQRDRLARIRTIRCKASLTREVVQRALGEIWPTGSPRLPEAQG